MSAERSQPLRVSGRARLKQTYFSTFTPFQNAT